MTLDEFVATLQQPNPPAECTPALKALWLAKRDRWDDAHTVVQDETDRSCAWVHAYLHRVEGDDWNARYWYGQAKKKPFIGSLESEWREITDALLTHE